MTTIRHYSSLFATVRHYSHYSRLFALFGTIRYSLCGFSRHPKNLLIDMFELCFSTFFFCGPEMWFHYIHILNIFFFHSFGLSPFILTHMCLIFKWFSILFVILESSKGLCFWDSRCSCHVWVPGSQIFSKS